MNEWRQKYAQHKSSAKRRGIPFELTYPQWLEIWGDKIGQRGNRCGDMVMCRHRDEGGYSVGNVRIDSSFANLREARILKNERIMAELAKEQGLAIQPSWLKRGNVFDEYTEDEEEYEY